MFRLSNCASDEEKLVTLTNIGFLEVLATTFGSGTPGRGVFLQVNQLATSSLEMPTVRLFATKVTFYGFFFDWC